MSEQLKQELEADTDRLETGTVAGSENNRGTGRKTSRGQIRGPGRR